MSVETTRPDTTNFSGSVRFFVSKMYRLQKVIL